MRFLHETAEGRSVRSGVPKSARSLSERLNSLAMRGLSEALKRHRPDFVLTYPVSTPQVHPSSTRREHWAHLGPAAIAAHAAH